jgi:Kdo2-lipid IVA lauroyltransferase/acyltransferase
MTNFKQIKLLPVFAVSILPMFLLYLLSDLSFIVLFYLVRYRRVIVYTNLKNSFPLKNESEIKAIEKAFYRHFCDIFIESIKVLTISKRELHKRFMVKNPGVIQKYYEEKRSITLYTAHQGNWEWLAFLPLFIPHQAIALYYPQSIKYFDTLMKTIRERFGVICIESNKGYKTISGFAERNILTMNYIIGDQSPSGGSTKHWIQFLNQDTAFLIGADRIAKKRNQVVIFPAFRKIERGIYEIEFKLIEEEPLLINNNEIIDKYAALLEETILVSPEMWLWSHRRWKISIVKQEQQIT